jgi:hypothetical protein
MPSPSKRPPRDIELQQLARRRLADAVRDGGRVDFTSASLGALMRLAGDPRSAPDALVLLHEMQVQQIELEMQIDELDRAAPAPAAAAGPQG